MAKKNTEDPNQTNKTKGLDQFKTKFEDKQPGLSKSISLSKDRKWLIIKTIRTDIVHVNYMQKIMVN